MYDASLHMLNVIGKRFLSRRCSDSRVQGVCVCVLWGKVFDAIYSRSRPPTRYSKRLPSESLENAFRSHSFKYCSLNVLG